MENSPHWKKWLNIYIKCKPSWRDWQCGTVEDLSVSNVRIYATKLVDLSSESAPTARECLACSIWQSINVQLNVHQSCSKNPKVQYPVRLLQTEIRINSHHFFTISSFSISSQPPALVVGEDWAHVISFSIVAGCNSPSDFFSTKNGF